MSGETQARFLREIAERIGAARIIEAHLFPPMRQGGAETGVAVVAATRDIDQDEQAQADAELAAALEQPAEDLALGLGPESDSTPDALADDFRDAPPAADAVRARRLTVYTARYRLMVKGLERGKWEFDIVADADAPLGTVDTVVRGVQRRAGDTTECERLGPEAFAEREAGAAWPPAT